MCTVTLSYDSQNVQAQQQLAALFTMGLFVELEENPVESVIGNSDTWLFEDHGDLTALPEDKEFYTPENCETFLSMT